MGVRAWPIGEHGGVYVRARWRGCGGQSIEASCGASAVAIIDISSLSGWWALLGLHAVSYVRVLGYANTCIPYGKAISGQHVLSLAVVAVKNASWPLIARHHVVLTHRDR